MTPGSTLRALAAFVLSTGVAVSCGGDGGDTGTTPEPDPEPAAIEAVSGDGQSAEVENSLAEPLVVQVIGTDGAAFQGASVSWSTSSGGGELDTDQTTTDAEGRASNTWTLGSEPGEHTVTAEVAGAGSVTFDAEAAPAPFEPEEDLEVSGSVQAKNVMVPGGVTVTVSDDVEMTATGAVKIAGSIRGDCTGVSIAGDSAVTITGEVTNSCSTPPSGSDEETPTLSIVGNGELSFDGRISSSGDITLSNDPTLEFPSVDTTDADGVTGAADPETAAPSSVSSPALQGDEEGACTYSGEVVADPETGARGDDGRKGDGGADGADLNLGCNGTVVLASVTARAGNGGRGGDGRDERADDAEAFGGAGGLPGDVVVLATEGVVLIGENRLIAGDGGDGGTAEATALPDPSRDVAPSAFASGGFAPGGGFVILTGSSGEVRTPVDNLHLFDQEASLEAVFGDGGEGGAATAVAASGADATAGRAAQPGGDVTAIGGNGRTLPLGNAARTFLEGLPGDVLNDLAGSNITMRGGAGGAGGDARGTAGDGGSGSASFRDGANGGNPSVQGGQGGNATSPDREPGGDGGRAVLEGGNGGAGFDACEKSDDRTGGVGGAGGDVLGEDGFGGQGSPNGTPGGTGLVNVGNGGEGGDGEPLGEGGSAGSGDRVLSAGEQVEVGRVLTDGPDGNPCDTRGVSGDYGISVAVSEDPAGHEPFVGMTSVTSLTVDVSEPTATSGPARASELDISFEGDAPWVDVSGVFDEESGEFEAGGEGTVAGYSNVDVLFEGTLTESDGLVGILTVGGDGALPTGQPVTYEVSGEK